MDIEKDKRDIVLLNEAIDQWERRLERFKKRNLTWHINDERCPLCRDIDSCEDCPVAKKIDAAGCGNTPFNKASLEFEYCKQGNTISYDLLKHTRAEIDFLVLLRNEIAERVENASKTQPYNSRYKKKITDQKNVGISQGKEMTYQKKKEHSKLYYIQCACNLIKTDFISTRSVKNVLQVSFGVFTSDKYIAQVLHQLSDQKYLKCISVNMHGENLYERVISNEKEI